MHLAIYLVNSKLRICISGDDVKWKMQFLDRFRIVIDVRNKYFEMVVTSLDITLDLESHVLSESDIGLVIFTLEIHVSQLNCFFDFD